MSRFAVKEIYGKSKQTNAEWIQPYLMKFNAVVAK